MLQTGGLQRDSKKFAVQKVSPSIFSKTPTISRRNSADKGSMKALAEGGLGTVEETHPDASE